MCFALLLSSTALVTRISYEKNSLSNLLENLLQKLRVFVEVLGPRRIDRYNLGSSNFHAHLEADQTRDNRPALDIAVAPI
jgi:hypothetical protein